MRTLILTTAFALGIGGLAAVGPASAESGIRVNGPWSQSSRNDCRTVERRVTRNGVTQITREKQCGDDRRAYRNDDRDDRYADRRDYRDRDDNRGINLNLGR